MGVAEEDLKESPLLVDLDERMAVLLLSVLLRWKREDVVEEGGARSKVDGSSCEEDLVQGFDDELGFRVEGEVGMVRGGVEFSTASVAFLLGAMAGEVRRWEEGEEGRKGVELEVGGQTASARRDSSSLQFR